MGLSLSDSMFYALLNYCGLSKDYSVIVYHNEPYVVDYTNLMSLLSECNIEEYGDKSGVRISKNNLDELLMNSQEDNGLTFNKSDDVKIFIDFIKSYLEMDEPTSIDIKRFYDIIEYEIYVEEIKVQKRF